MITLSKTRFFTQSYLIKLILQILQNIQLNIITKSHIRSIVEFIILSGMRYQTCFYWLIEVEMRCCPVNQNKHTQ